MAKILDITDKLSFDENPALTIKGKKLEVNGDAPTMLKIMSFMGDNGISTSQLNDAYELIFPEKSRIEIGKMKLGMSDWMIVIQEAIALIAGDNQPGEQ